jgi:hypothetical protein
MNCKHFLQIFNLLFSGLSILLTFLFRVLAQVKQIFVRLKEH